MATWGGNSDSFGIDATANRIGPMEDDGFEEPLPGACDFARSPRHLRRRGLDESRLRSLDAYWCAQLRRNERLSDEKTFLFCCENNVLQRMSAENSTQTRQPGQTS